MMADAASPDEPPAEAWPARLLLRAARVGTLATADADRMPHAALVTPASAEDGAPLLLLSRLSAHTRHLEADGRCALLVAGTATDANPQTAPRLSLAGIATRDDSPASRARYLAIHPYASLYAGFTDFGLWRLTASSGHFVGGFARAARLPAAALRPDPSAVSTIAELADGILLHCNNDHAEAMTVIAHRAGGDGDAWRMVTVDVDGCDLADGTRSLRVPWQAPVRDAGGIRAELIRLAAR